MFLDLIAISQKYKKHDVESFTALEDIDLQIKEGEFVSLLGPSGCGKSTLLSIVAGLTKPSKGKVLLKGNEVTQPGPDRGVVFQEAALFPWLNVFDNVMFPLRKKGKSNDLEKTVMNHLQMVHLTRFAKNYPHELSGGMQQRVAIARAFAMNPEVLLMDEPFGALDEQTRTVLQQELVKIWMKSEKTILFVTHNIQEAIKLSDRIIIMGTRPGKIISDINVNLPRPRENWREEMLKMEKDVMTKLNHEIDKVMKEELDYANYA